MFNGNIKRDATITKIKLSCVFASHSVAHRFFSQNDMFRFLMIYLFSFFACLVIFFFDNIYIYIYIRSMITPEA